MPPPLPPPASPPPALAVDATPPTAQRECYAVEDVSVQAEPGIASQDKKTKTTLTLKEKRACVNEALLRFNLRRNEDGSWDRDDTSAELSENTVWFATASKKLYLRQVSQWSRDDIFLQWDAYCNHPDVVKQWGSPVKAFAGTRRLPNWWHGHIHRRTESAAATAAHPTAVEVGPAAAEAIVPAVAPVPVRRLRRSSSASTMHIALSPASPAIHTADPGAEVATPEAAVDMSPEFRLSAGSKPTILEKHPDMVAVIKEWNARHEEQRAQDNDCSFQSLYKSFNHVLQRKRQDLINAGVETALPVKVSTGWYCQMKATLGVRNNSTASRELKRPREEDDQAFLDDLRAVKRAKCIAPQDIIVFDETNATYAPDAKRVQAAPSELKAKSRRRVRRRIGGRQGFTVCATYSLLKKGKLLFLFNRAPQWILRDIKTTFGNRVAVYTKFGRWMNGSAHVHALLPEVLGPFVDELRRDRPQSTDVHGSNLEPQQPWSMFIEDDCKAHKSDKCNKTGEIGLRALRQAWFDTRHVNQKLILGGGTPDRAAPDQMFKVLKMLALSATNELMGLHDLHHMRPTQEACRTGGAVITEGGNARRAHEFLIVAAWLKAWLTLPQLTLGASFVRAEVVTAEEAATAFRVSPGAISAGMQDLRERQQHVKQSSKWLDKGHDFTGTGQAWPHMPKPTEADMAALKRSADDVAWIQLCVEPVSLTQLQDAVGADQVPDVAFNAFIDDADARADTALCNLASKPTKDNVGELEFFKVAMLLVLRRAGTLWSRQTESRQRVILEFHHMKLREKFLRMVEEKDPRAVRKVGRHLHPVPFSQCVWDILKVMSGHEGNQLSDLVRRMVVETNRLSMAPRAGRPQPKAKPKPKAKSGASVAR